MRVSEILRHKGADVITISPSATVEELVCSAQSSTISAP